MERIDSKAHGSLQTIRGARVKRVCSQEERACLMLSHEEDSGRLSREWREARGEDGAPLSCLIDEEEGTLLTRGKKKKNDKRTVAEEVYTEGG